MLAPGMQSVYQDTLDAVEKKVGLMDASSFTSDRMSTGLLSLDLMIGGGITPGMYTFAGAEQSCKTTCALTIMTSAIKHNVPICSFWDYEGSVSDPDYLGNIITSMGLKASVEDVFGVKDPKTGKWAVPPRVRYRDESLGEVFFDWLAALERRLPDKKYVAGSWWYIYEDNKENKAKISDMVDARMTRQQGSGLYVPAEDGALQAVVLLDSYPAMNPEAMDEDDPNNSLALTARMFSKNLPRVKGRLRSKRIALLGINQLRAIPMAMYGPKEAEPCGQALLFNSDCRVRNTSRSLSGAPFNPKGEGQIEMEASAEYEGTQDKYRYIASKTVKNKLGQPFRETWYRLWVEDGAGNPRGFDPVFDTIQYLSQTGQISGKGRGAFTLNINGVEAKKTVSWAGIKKWVLTRDKQEITDVCKTLGFPKAFSLRNTCFKQLKEGKSEVLYTAAKNAKNKVAKDDDE